MMRTPENMQRELWTAIDLGDAIHLPRESGP